MLKNELVDVLNISADIVQNILSLKYRLVSMLNIVVAPSIIS